MASNQIPLLLQCTGCHVELNFDSRTFPCLHSFCRSCLDKDFEGQKNGNGKCPECDECVALDQLSLSPFLKKSLRRQQLETNDLNCDLCIEDGIESIGSESCNECQKIFCASCSRFHKKLNPEHDSRRLDEIERDEVLKAMVKDICSLHHKEKDSYCQQCNMCVCDTCYKVHTVDFPGCPPQPLSAREEALKLKSQGPTLTKEMADLEMDLKNLNKTATDYTKKLNSNCDSKCKQLWENYEEIMEKAKQRTDELCREMKKLTAEQVDRWRQLMEETENILKQLEIWRLNLETLLNDSLQQNMDVVCGLQSLKTKLSTRLQKSVRHVEECELEVSFLDWWMQIKKELETKKIGSVSLTSEKLNINNLVFDKQWKLHISGLITSIYVSPEDKHLFVSSSANNSVMEYTESGELVFECQLSDGTNKFKPYGICSISPDVLVIACGQESKLIFLDRQKVSPFLRIKKIMQTDKRYYFLSERNGTIFAGSNDGGCLQIDSFSKEGNKLKTIKTQESGNGKIPIIHADPLSGNIWGAFWHLSEIFCYNLNGEKLCSVQTKEKITDIFVDKFGRSYFCTKEGIFSASPEKLLYKFEAQDLWYPKMFISRNQFFVSYSTSGQNSINIYKISR